jgi:hypothetical protein
LKLVFLAPVGRGGSFLNHVLLANHPKIRTTECCVSLTKITKDAREKDIFNVENICETQLSIDTSLWALDFEESNHISNNLNDHTICVCRRTESDDSVNLIHSHNLFYDPIEFESFCRMIANEKSVVLISCVRDWIQTISSRQRTYPLTDVPRWVSILYWIIIEDIARSASIKLSSYIETLHIDLLKWHLEPESTWKKLLNFIQIPPTNFPMQPNLRGIPWRGGNKDKNVVGINHAKYLMTNSLTEHETTAVQFMLNSKNSVPTRLIREIIFLFADLIIFSMYVTRTIKVIPAYFNTKTCKKCDKTKRNLYSGIRLPVYVDLFLDFVRHVRHIVRSGGANDYRVARRNIRKWKQALYTLEGLDD